jgi:hypothetical protein
MTSPLMLMPPSDRILTNAYRTLAYHYNHPMTTCDEHMAYLCKHLINNYPTVAAYLPFPNKIDIWDWDYAFKEYERACRNPVHPFLSVSKRTITYGDEQVDALVIIESRSPRINLPTLPTLDEDDFDEDEERDRRDDRYIKITYTATETRIRKVKRMLSVYVEDADSMSADDLHDAINNKIRDGQYHDGYRSCMEDRGQINSDQIFLFYNIYDHDEDEEEEHDYGSEQALSNLSELSHHLAQ